MSERVAIVGTGLIGRAWAIAFARSGAAAGRLGRAAARPRSGRGCRSRPGRRASAGATGG
jgi:hypothetical protein